MGSYRRRCARHWPMALVNVPYTPVELRAARVGSAGALPHLRAASVARRLLPH